MKLLNSLFLKRSVTAKLLTVMLIVMPFTAMAESEKSQSFSGVDNINVKTISGDLTLISSNSGEIEVTVFSTYNDDKLKMVMEQNGNELVLQEKSKGRGSFSGESRWTVAVPDGLESTIKFSTASGDFKSSEVSATLKINTASGDIIISDYEGHAKANTASGDIKLMNVKGELKFNTASGDVDAKSIHLTGNSYFNSASGDVEVSLTQSPMHNLKVSSASGDVELDMQGNDLQGRVSLTTKNKSRYRINAPFEFDNTEITMRHNQEYITKSATIGDASTLIMLETSSGNASIKE